jgi:two-component system, chemotaxis family, chemotaxis protein CheY
MSSGKELGKPSLLGTGEFFANITMGLVHTDPRAAMVVKSVLDSLACRAILIFRDGSDLASRLEREGMDLVVMDWGLRSTKGVDAVRQLRRSNRASARSLPIILLGPGKDIHMMSSARDAGVTEYVRKPFTARSLLASVYSVVESPRPFVVSLEYAGPDRRDNPSFSTYLPRVPYRQCRRNQTPLAVNPGEEPSFEPDVPRLYLPDYRLKRKMGLDAPDHLITSPAAIDRIEESLDQAKSRYALSVQAEVREIIAYNRLLLQKSDRAGEIVEAIKNLAATIEARTTELGYVRIPEVARLLQSFCACHFRPGNGRSVILLEKHALTLMAMLRGGKIVQPFFCKS